MQEHGGASIARRWTAMALSIATGVAFLAMAIPAGAVSDDVVVNEILQNPSAVSDGSGEWFEVYNAGVSPVDIDGWTVSDDGSDSFVIANGGPLVVPAGGFLVLGNNGDVSTNGGVTVDYEYSGMFLANGADELVLLDGSTEVDRVEYDGGPVFPDPNGASMALVDPALDNNVGGNWCVASTPFGSGDLGTPGAANDCAPPPPTPVPMKIHEVQGAGPASPVDGVWVTIEGVVVGDFQGGSSVGLNGFHVQEQDVDVDADPATSEGIFVFDGSFGVEVSVGDVVEVTGQVDEFFNLTEIKNVTAVTVSGTDVLPTAASLSLPMTPSDDLEAYEGMLVTFPQALSIVEFFNFGRFGEIVLSDGRPFQPTAVEEPGSAAFAALRDANALNRIILDDGRSGQNPDPARHPNGLPFTLTNLFRGGDTLTNVTGVMDYAFGNYKIQPTTGADHAPANPRPSGPPDVGGDLTVASFNVLNYFTTLDNAGPICGPIGGQGCRGADNATEFERQKDKIVDAVMDLDADIVGLMEIENHATDAALADLAGALPGYDYVATGPVGTDAIKVAFLYKTSTVDLVGAYAVLDASVDLRFNDEKNRPALAQTFAEKGTGEMLTVVVNHLKSKGSNCDALGDPDIGDGAGNCNLTRAAAAAAMVDWLSTDPTGSGDADFLIIGDLNSYDKEDPIDALVAGGYTDLLAAFGGEYAYTYVFDGQLGYLDYALANGSLQPQVTGTSAWAINADEANLIDYDTSFKKTAQDAIYYPDEFRSSDHDPVVVGLLLDEAGPHVEITLSKDVLWPANHKYVEVTAELAIADRTGVASVVLTSVTSNEDDDGKGDGNTKDDIVIIDDTTFLLRAERAGGGDGRVYTITYTVTDLLGNVTVASAEVRVPKSMRGGSKRPK